MTAETDREDDAALAGEYVLGLLSAADARAFEARLNGDPDLRALVARFSEDFASLTDPIAPVAPPPGLKTAIDAQLFPAAERSRTSPLRFLLGLAVGAIAVLAVIALLPQISPKAPVYHAQIASQNSELVVLAVLDTGTGTLTLSRSAGAPAPGRSLQLWLIAKGAATPMPLDVIDAAQSTHNVPAELVPLFIDGTLAISDEPLGGSPTGTPTTVLATAPVTLV